MSQLDIFGLEGRVAIVAGGGGAIGAAMAEALAGAGARVAVAGRTEATLNATVARIRAAGSEGLAVTANATDEADADRLVAETVAAFGRVDIIVNAVGGGAGEVLNPAEAYPREAWDWIMELNVRSTIVPTMAVARRLIEQGEGGAVLNITSVRANLGINAGLLGLRRGEGGDQLADPAVGDRVGEVRHPGQRDHADVRRHPPGRDAARRPGVQGRHRQPDPAPASRARPATSSAPRSSCARTPRRSSRARSSGSTAA